jgi:hypothetical protein
MTYFLVRSTGKKERKRVLMERRLYEWPEGQFCNINGYATLSNEK